MVTYLVPDDEPETLINFKPVYSDQSTLHKNQDFMFDFQTMYTKIPEPDSDGDEDLDYDNYETRDPIRQILFFGKDVILGGDEHHTQALVLHILELIRVPKYQDIVMRLTGEILDLKKRYVMSTLPKVERICVNIDVMVWQFPGEGEEAEDVDVRLAVDPASDEAVEEHFETVVVEKKGYCVICMDDIKVGSDVEEAGRMPCLHVFHRSCGVDWLRNSGVCPVCRAEFPS